MIIIIFVIVLGIIVGIYLYNSNNLVKEDFKNTNTEVISDNNYIEEKNIIEISNIEEKTSPNTLLIYKTYYTKCSHYINEYKDIDISLVNLTEKEFKNYIREWKIEKFSPEQIILTREVEDFCGEHFKLKLVNGKIIIYIINENEVETEYEETEITEEFLTKEDVLKLKEGIIVYGKENLTNTIEDYE